MNMDNYIKKRMLFFICSFIVLIIITITATYAIFNSDFNRSSNIVVNSKNLELVYLNESTSLTMNGNTYDKNLYEGVPSNIVKVINKTKKEIEYKIYLTETSGNRFDLSKLYYSVDGDVYQMNNDGMILISNIEPKFSNIYDIKIWLGSDLIEDEDLGKKLRFTLNVTEE